MLFHFVEIYLQRTETFIYNYIIKASEKFDVCIVTFDAQNMDLFPLPDNVRLVVLAPDIYKRRSLSGLFRFVKESITKKKKWYDPLYKQINCSDSIVHCHFGPIGVLFSAFRKRMSWQGKFILSFYGYDISRLPSESEVYREALKDVWVQADKLLIEGPEMQKKLIALGAPINKVNINPIIINCDSYVVRKNGYNRSQNEIQYLLIGRFIEKKGFHLFLQALGELFEAGENIGQIVFIGAGPMGNTYLSLIEKYGLKSHVRFEGYKSLKECNEYMLSADVFVHTSVLAQNGDSEGGAPTILLEAQYIGIPVIASTHADIPNVMGYDETLAHEGDILDIQQKIKFFSQLPAYQVDELIRKGRDKVLSNHSFASEEYLKILSEK